MVVLVDISDLRSLESRYEIKKKVGEGGMAAVFSAQDRILDRTVAIKVLSGCANGGSLMRFQREAQALSELHHRNFVEVYDFGVIEKSTNAFLVMELVQGVSLDDLLSQKGSLSTLEVISLAIGITTAMEHAHERGLVHRDLKPSNIMIKDCDRLEDLKILDFGISKFGDDRGQDLTSSGGFLGTPLYMSPEQATNSADVTNKTDLYSLGCILYECVSGTPPFVGKSPAETIALHLSARPVPLTASGGEDSLEGRLYKVILGLLGKEPGYRYGSMARLKEALLDWQDEEQNSDIPAVAVQPENRRAKKLAPALTVLAILLASALYVVFMVQSRRPENHSVAPQDEVTHQKIWDRVSNEYAIYILGIKKKSKKHAPELESLKWYQALSQDDFTNDPRRPLGVAFDAPKPCLSIEFDAPAEIWAQIGQLKLTGLRLKSEKSVDTFIIDEVAKIQSLECLVLKNQGTMTKAELKKLTQLRNLKVIDFRDYELPRDSAPTIVSAWPELSVLILSGTKLRGSDHIAAQLSKLKKLRKLGVQELELTDADLKQLSVLESLEKLELQGNNGITKKGLNELSRLKKLGTISRDLIVPITSREQSAFNESREKLGLKPVKFDGQAPDELKSNMSLSKDAWKKTLEEQSIKDLIGR
ncbi:MAG: serine/threonine protein kinase [Candidatus Obscuribacterales bacterium]|nr:serine/threonine protein kinase [Candidatus Obscuribacterales bacterium]